MSDALISSLKEPPKDPRRRCYFGSDWLPSQSEERKASVLAALANPKWKTAALYNVLKEFGYEKQYNTLRAHRAKECSCDF